MATSKYFCPVCKQPLSVDRGLFTESDWMLYCPAGPCADLPGGGAANEGGSGLTEEEAYRALVKAVEKEQEAE